MEENDKPKPPSCQPRNVVDFQTWRHSGLIRGRPRNDEHQELAPNHGWDQAFGFLREKRAEYEALTPSQCVAYRTIHRRTSSETSYILFGSKEPEGQND